MGLYNQNYTFNQSYSSKSQTNEHDAKKYITSWIILFVTFVVTCMSSVWLFLLRKVIGYSGLSMFSILEIILGIVAMVTFMVALIVITIAKNKFNNKSIKAGFVTQMIVLGLFVCYGLYVFLSAGISCVDYIVDSCQGCQEMF